jgi:membrane protein
VLVRVWQRVADNHLDLVAAGVAFYGLLALFPAVAALVSVFGLIADPAEVGEQLTGLRPVMPAEAYDLMSDQMRALGARSGNVLGAGLAGALALSLWSAARGTKSLIMALNIVYDEREDRGFFHLNALALGMTLMLILLVVLALAMVVALPVVLGFIGLGAISDTLVLWLRWPLLAGLMLAALAVIYRYGPSRHEARWRWVTWGSGLAVALWLVASALFSFYVSQFGTFNATYGSIGAVIVLLMWLYLSGFVVVLGAQVNAEMERQTARDTTIHGDKPLGERGAYVADHLPEDA